MSKLPLIACLFLAASALAQDCYDYEQPAASLVVASHALSGEVRGLDADADWLCWAESTSTNAYMILHWCRMGAHGGLTELAAHRLRRGGADYVAAYLQVDGQRVVVGDGAGLWQVIDFADPAAPRLAWESTADSAARRAALRGRWLYLASTAGLALRDLVDGQPPVPRSLLTVEAEEPAYANNGIIGLAVDGNRVWALTSDSIYDGGVVSLLLVDYADPDAPVVRDRLPVGGWDEDDDQWISAFVADQGQALIVRQLRHWNGSPYDFSYRRDARFFSWNDADQVSETSNHSLGFYGDAVMAGNRAWVSGSRLVRYFERRNSTWTPIDTVADDWAGVPDLAVGQGLLWAASARRLTAAVAKLPEAWPVFAQVFRPSTGTCSRLALSGCGLFALAGPLWREHWGDAGWGLVGMQPVAPDRVEQQPMFVVGNYDYISLGIVGNHAYSSDGIWDLRTRARVNTAGPAIFGATGVTLWGVDQGHLAAYDGSDPAAPVLHGRYFTVSWSTVDTQLFATSPAQAFFANGDTLIVAGLAAPFVPLVTDRLVTGLGEIRDLAWQDGFVYVAQSAGLAVVGVAPDGQATLRGSLGGPGAGLNAVAPGGRALYAVDADGQVRVIDIGNPDLPRLIAVPPVGARDVVYLDGVVYLRDDGVTAMRAQCTPSLAVALTELSLDWRAGTARMSWRLNAELLGVRVLARSGGSEWIVPWRVDGDRQVAVDRVAPPGRTVTYAVQTLVDGDWATLREESLAIPATGLALAAPAPNPFNGGTEFRYSLDASGPVAVVVYDVAGRAVRTLVDARQEAGDHVVAWQGEDDAGRPAAAGSYLVRLSTGRGQRSVRVLLLK